MTIGMECRLGQIRKLWARSSMGNQQQLRVLREESRLRDGGDDAWRPKRPYERYPADRDSSGQHCAEVKVKD